MFAKVCIIACPLETLAKFSSSTRPAISTSIFGWGLRGAAAILSSAKGRRWYVWWV
jgi:hypothetical protein